MNNTEKLLRAFIEASGYEVEEVLVNPRPLVCNDKPTNRMTYDYIDYKVTKREDNYALSSSSDFTKEERASFIDREISHLTRRKESILNEKTT